MVLQRLPPAERIALVLHDMFDLPFEEVGPIVGRSPIAARQLASRARRRVQGAPASTDADLTAQQKIVDAFLAASRGGELDALLALLDPNIVFRADRTATQAGAASVVHGAASVAQFFKGRAQGARAALINGAVGAVVAPRGQLFLALGFTIREGKIAELNAVADPERLRELKLAVLTSDA